MKRTVVCCCALLFLAAGCTQAPAQLESAQMRAGADPASAGGYIISVDGIVHNESGSVAFTGYQAEIDVLAKDGTVLLAVPSEKKDIFPFMTVQIRGSVSVDAALFAKLSSEFALPPADQKNAADDNGGTILPDGQVSLRKITYAKKDIVTLIEGDKK